jgi:murein L,D-transpeptidase YafK
LRLLALIGLSGLLAALNGHGDPQGAEAANRSRAPLEHRLAAKGFHLGDRAFVRIFKSENRLEVWLERAGRYELFETYPICRWSGGQGPKIREGDGQAPEGFYAIGKSQLNPNSKYTLAFNLGFPNAYDRANGRTGSALMVHGVCASIGCYAMTDPGIRDIYALVEAALNKGQIAVAVDAFPFRMTSQNLADHSQDRWAGFWGDLSAGNEAFQTTGRPATIYSCGARYRIQSGPGCIRVRTGG